MDYRLAPIEEVVDTAILICPGATDEHRVMFRQFVWEAQKLIGPTKHWVKTCKLIPKNRSFKKPDDYASSLAIALFDVTDGEIPFEFFGEGGRVHSDRASVHASGNIEAVTGRVDLSEDAYYFHLGSNTTNVAYAMIRYLALPVDKNGQLLIPEDNIFACTMFCRWMWALRKGDNQSEIQLQRDTWYREKDRIFGDNKMPSWFDAKEFGKKFLSLINGYKPDRF